MQYPINEMFQTLQGEGYFTGVPAIFIRLQGCPVGCAWCDTKHTWEKLEDREVSLFSILAKTKESDKWGAASSEDLLAVIAAYSQAHTWDAVVPLSAKTGENCDILFEEFEKFAIEGPQLFPDDMLCDQPERQLVAEIIREKMLLNLDREVPHGTAVAVEQMREREDGLMDIAATIYCEKKSHKGIIIGKSGSMLKQIGAQARTDMEELLDTRVYLQLWVKVKEGWRNNQYQMRNFGYENE